MTAMPQLVAAFPQPGRHGRGAGRRCGFSQSRGVRHPGLPRQRRSNAMVSRIEMGLGVAIGAITFSGSVIAFLKLNGNMGGKPILLPARHVINLGTAGRDPWADRLLHQNQSPWVFWTHRRAELRHRLSADHPDRGRRHAGRDLDAQQLFGLGGGGDGFHAAQHGDDHHRRAGRQLGRDPQLHHVPGDEPQLHLGHRRRVRRGRIERARPPPSTGRTSAVRPRTPPS